LHPFLPLNPTIKNCRVPAARIKFGHGTYEILYLRCYDGLATRATNIARDELTRVLRLRARNTLLSCPHYLVRFCADDRIALAGAVLEAITVGGT
jgi:hypothetical protein